MFGLHVLDLIVILCYFVVMLCIGYWASGKIHGEEDYFMGSRRFGKLRSLFVTFGMATSSETAIGTSREAYRQGLAGVWVSMFVLFTTPFYWILAPWYRRLRMISTGDFFRERFDSRGLESLYAVVGVIYFMGLIALGLISLQKTVEVLLPKPVSAYTQEDHSRIEAFDRYQVLEQQAAFDPLTPTESAEFGRLKQLHDRGWATAPSGISWVNPVVFLIAIASIVILYSISGGLLAAASTDMVQGILMLLMSVFMLPLALNQVGGFSGLHEAAPPEMFNVFGSLSASEYPWYYIAALTLLGLAGTPGSANNFSTMGGAAKDDLSARIGTTYGAFLKRFTIVLWGYTGVVGWTLYHQQVSDADMIWGYMTMQLLGPGFIGLMIVCLLAAVMSSADSFMIAAGALVSRNLFGQLIRHASGSTKVLAGRASALGVMTGAVLICLVYNDMLELLKFLWPIPLCFGPVIWMGIIWRRTNRLAAWSAVTYSLLTAFFLANAGAFMPPISRSEYFTSMTQPQAVMVDAPAMQTDVEAGRASTAGQLIAKRMQIPAKPIFFEKMEYDDPADPDSPRTGRGRFKVALLWPAMLGVPLERLSFAALNSLGFVLDTILPFVIIIIGSRFGKPNSIEAVDKFYGTLHTPTQSDPQVDAEEVARSVADPHRFDGQRMFPGTNIELLRPTAVDIVGFLIAVVFVFVVIGFMLALAQLGKP